jgi:hypothetical protein
VCLVEEQEDGEETKEEEGKEVGEDEKEVLVESGAL